MTGIKSILTMLTALVLLMPQFSFAGEVNLSKTGQTICYDASGNVIDCAGTGQDGDIQAGVDRPVRTGQGGSSNGEEIVVQPGPEDGADVWITSVYYDGGQDDYKLRVGGWADYYYSLLKFNLDTLPTEIKSAKIYLYSFYNGHSYRTPMYLDRIASTWDETTIWSSFNPSYVNTCSLPAPTLDAWYVIDITDLYKAWKSGAYENNGIQLRPTNINNAMNAFYSSDYMDNLSLRPKLVIETSLSVSELTISHPNSGEILVKGQDYTITWNSSNVTGNIQIDLYKGGTEPENMLIQLAAATANDGEYPFSPTDIFEDGSDYYIGISAENGTVWDFSDAPFGIHTPDLAAGLVAYYPFNGNANDESGNGNNGTEHGGVSLTTDRFGNAGSAYFFDGNDNYIAVQDSISLDTPNELTVSLFVNMDSYTYGTVLISKGWGDSGPFYVQFHPNNNSLLGLLTTTEHGRLSLWGNVTRPLDGKWHHYAMTFKSGEQCLYFDGVLMVSAQYDGTLIENDFPLYIGNMTNRNYPVNGKIDDIRIYNRTLTESEILSLYNEGTTSAPTLISPQNNNTVNDNNLTFEWTSVTGAVGYEIQADEDCSFTTPEINLYIDGGATTSTTLENYLTDDTYCWRVRAKFGDNDYSDWSQSSGTEWQFTYQLPECAAPVWTPFYRLYKGGSTNRDHFYTSNAKERDNALDSGIWIYERIECSVSNCKTSGMTPLFRLYYNGDNKEDHFYTTNKTEINSAIELGYEYEGIAGFVYPSQVPADGRVPLYRLYNESDMNHFYCTRTSEQDYASSTWLFNNEGVECYVMPSESPDPLSGGRPSGFYGTMNTATGAYHYSHTDVSFPSPGHSIFFKRSYSSGSTSEGMFGIGWTHSWDWRIYETEGYYVVYKGAAGMDYYEHTTLEPMFGGVYNELSRNGDILTLTTPDKTKYEFGYPSYEAEDKKNGFFLEKISDRYANELVFEYFDGRLIKITDPVGRILNFAYDADGHIETISDPQLTRTLSFEVDSKTKNLLSSTDWLGNQTLYEYEEDVSGGKTHRIVKIIRPGNKTLIINEYDKGKLAAQTDALGNKTTYTCDSEGTHALDPLLNTADYADNDFYELDQMTDKNNNSRLYLYNDDHELTDFRDRRGHDSFFDYAENTGNITGITHNIEDSDTITTLYTYDPVFTSFPKTHINPLSKTTEFTYDENGNLTQIKDPANNTIIKEYYPNGLLKSVTDKNGHKTSYYYEDARQNLTRVVDPSGAETNYTYDEAGRRVSMTNPSGYNTFYEYDLNGNLKKTTNHLGNETTYDYDENNNLVKITDALHHETVFTYDLKDQLLKKQDGAGNFETYTYDALGRRTSITDANNNVTTMQYDGNGNLIKTLTPLSTINYEYDEKGSLIKIIDARNNIVDKKYSFMGQLAETKDQLLQTTIYSYWKDGNIFSRTDANGTRTEYFYDDLARLTSIHYSDAANISFEYDNKGNLKKMTDALGDTTYDYDVNDRLLSVTGPYGKTVSYEYDFNGNKTAIIYPGNKTVFYGYDSLDRLRTVTDWLGGVTTCYYDAAGNLIRIDNPNTTQTFFTYDNAGRLTDLSSKKSNCTVICAYSYTLDNIGNIITIDEDLPIAPVYPAKNTSGVYNEANQLTSYGEFTCTYDNNGNLTGRFIAGATTAFSYNNENLLTEISGSTSLNNLYNGMGHRISRTAGGAETRYVLDFASPLSNILTETDAAGNIKAYYIHGLGLISRISADDTRLVYHFNHRGDTIALTDSSQNITDAYAYDEFGKALNRAGATGNPFTYVGKYGVMDEGNSLYFMRARFYNADSGRFLSKDPLGIKGGDLNLYAYVGGNPIMGIDPEGKYSWKSFFNDLKAVAFDYIPTANDQALLIEMVKSINKLRETQSNYSKENWRYYRLEWSIQNTKAETFHIISRMGWNAVIDILKSTLGKAAETMIWLNELKEDPKLKEILDADIVKPLKAY